ncbi:MAG: type II secretion system major pseudopilin GspG [Helicobacteraceae bacterium]|nr:type II secretion system major pseudopilin GspG [Helicobacteraceae bacterium]
MRKGFTLLELMIIIVILGLLASLVLPNLLGKSEEAKRKLVCIQMQSINESLKSFRFDNGMYPDTEEGINALLKNPDEEKYKNYASSGYLDSKNPPRDPWKNEYIYINEDGELNIISLAADGKDGGKEQAKDITLIECQK